MPASFWYKGLVTFQELESSILSVTKCFFFQSEGCLSTIGYQGKKQSLSIGTNCEHYSIIQHEFLHALGFYHEQARPDRDEYVKILNENIQDGS
jgi:hypothetical protein